MIQDAYAAHMTQDEDGWDAALEDRNLLIHTYYEDEALAALERVRATYLPLLKDLLATIEENWT